MSAESVIAAIRTQVDGSATAMNDNYRNDTTKLTPGTLFYQLRAAMQIIDEIDANNTLEVLSVELEFFYVKPTAEAETVFTEGTDADHMQPILRLYLSKLTWNGIAGIRNVVGDAGDFNVSGAPELGDIERIGDLIKFTLTTHVVVSN